MRTLVFKVRLCRQFYIVNDIHLQHNMYEYIQFFFNFSYRYYFWVRYSWLESAIYTHSDISDIHMSSFTDTFFPSLMNKHKMHSIPMRSTHNDVSISHSSIINNNNIGNYEEKKFDHLNHFITMQTIDNIDFLM